MNIYVGNLARDVTEEELRLAFEAFGQVTSVNLITDKFSGEPRGFAFVEMPAKTEAESAINDLNGKELKGRELNVNEARPRTEGRRGGGGRGGGGRGAAAVGAEEAAAEAAAVVGGGSRKPGSDIRDSYDSDNLPSLGRRPAPAAVRTSKGR